MRLKPVVCGACVVIGCIMVTWSLTQYESRTQALRDATLAAQEIIDSDALVAQHRSDPTILRSAFRRIGGPYNGANDRFLPVLVGSVLVAFGALLPLVGPKKSSSP